MKKNLGILWVLTFMLLVFWAVPSCSKKEEPQNKPEGVSMEDVKKEAKEAYSTTKAYTQEQMEAFLQETETKIAQYEEDIDQLQDKAEKLEGDARAKAEQQLTALRQKRDAVSRKLEDLSSSSADAWEQIKSGVDAAMDDLDKAYEKAAAEFGQS